VIEEAHRLLSGGGTPRADGGESGRDRAVRAFTEAIAELRALGEGFVLSTQRPTELSESAVANAGTRLLHRLESARDRAVLLDDADLDERGRAGAARLRTGEVVLRWADRDEADIVAVAAPPVSTAEDLPDEAVAEHMAAERAATLAVRPYRLCGEDLCPAGCDRRVRAAGRRIAVDLELSARRTWEAHDDPAEVLTHLGRDLLDRASGAVRTAYCGAVHLEATGAALRVPEVDVRAPLGAAIRRLAADDVQGGWRDA
jgi:hypothetical protein